jgi:glycosyltransferase involved in cell wall biosynthesis
VVGQDQPESDGLRVQLVSKPGSAATGIGRYAAELERGLRAAGMDVRNAALLPSVPAPMNRAARMAGYDLEAFGRSYPLRADLTDGYITHLTSQSLATLLLSQRLPRPVVVTVHDILPYLLRDDPALSVYRHRVDRLMDDLAMRGLRRADRLIADSHYTKHTVVETLGVPPERIDVVHLGVDTERFRPQPVPESFRRRYDLPEGGAYVLAVGSEDPRKDLPTLLRAIALLRRDAVEATLLKVGKPAFTEQRARNLRLCRELGIADAVRWFDGVSEDDLPLFYNVANVFAFPSRYEGFGFPVLEALACGTPVVAVRASSVPELGGSAVRWVAEMEPNALYRGIRSILDSVGERDRLRRLGLNQVAQFTWESTCEATFRALKIAEDLHSRVPFGGQP